MILYEFGNSQLANIFNGLERLNCPRFTLPEYWKDTWAAIVQRVEFVALVSSNGRSQTVARYHLRTKATYL